MFGSIHRPNYDAVHSYNSSSTMIFLISTNNTAPNEYIDDTAMPNRRDTILVILAVLSVTGCFICFLCKCSNSCGSSHHFDIDDDDYDDNNSNNNPMMMMIEMGDLAHMENINPLDVVSVAATLDQELSEDERSIRQTHPSTGSTP